MEIGTVAGSVWATRKAHELGRHTLLTVQTDQGRRVAAMPWACSIISSMIKM